MAAIHVNQDRGKLLVLELRSQSGKCCTKRLEQSFDVPTTLFHDLNYDPTPVLRIILPLHETGLLQSVDHGSYCPRSQAAFLG